MHVYQDKQGKLRAERRISTMADRRVKTPMARRLGGTRAGLDNNYRDGMLYVADRRAKTTDDLTEGCPITPTVVEHTPGKTAQEKFDRAKSYNSGNSALLIEYREALIKAYGLGNHIKELYGIVPPKVIYNSALASSVYLKEGYQGVAVTISLNVN
jgi:hypothetical protein